MHLKNVFLFKNGYESLVLAFIFSAAWVQLHRLYGQLQAKWGSGGPDGVHRTEAQGGRGGGLCSLRHESLQEQLSVSQRWLLLRGLEQVHLQVSDGIHGAHLSAG